MSDTTDILTGAAGQDVEPATSAAPAPAPADADAGPPASDPRPRRRASGLSGMLLPELQALATSLGISGVGRMRKGDLVSAIQARQSGNDTPTGGGGPAGQAQLPLGGTPAPTATPVTDVPAGARPVLTGQPDAAVATATTDTAVSGTGRAPMGAAPETGGVSSDTRSMDPAAGGRGREGRQRRSASRPAGSPDVGRSADAVTDGVETGNRPEQVERADRGDRPERGGDQREPRRERGDQDRTSEDGDGQPGSAGDRRRERGQGDRADRQGGDRDRDRQVDGQRVAQ